jgi:ATP-dependent DNA helicase RecG
MISKNKDITSKDLAEKIGITKRGVEKNIAKLKEKGFLIRIGSDRTGYWEVEDRRKTD